MQSGLRRCGGVGGRADALRRFAQGFSSALGTRVSNVLKHLFPVPKDDSKRVVTFANQSDFISFRHHTYDMPRGAKSVALKEVRMHAGGPVQHFMCSPALPLARRLARASRCGCIASSWAPWSSRRRRWNGRCGRTCGRARSKNSERARPRLDSNRRATSISKQRNKHTSTPPAL